MPWYAVRTIYKHSTDEDGTGVFGERILLFRAGSSEQAAELAQTEAKQYLKLNEGFTLHDHIGVYVLGHDEENLNGVEVWSMVNEAKMELVEFYKQKFERFEIQPT